MFLHSSKTKLNFLCFLDPPLNVSINNFQSIIYEDSVTFLLPNTTAISKFDLKFDTIWVVVQRIEKQRRKRSTLLTLPVTLTVNGTNTYITGKISLKQANATFTIGDEQIYENTENKKLQPGNYIIYVGYKAVTENIVTEFYQLNQELIQSMCT